MLDGRRLFIGGNWKSHGSVAAVSDLVQHVVNAIHVDSRHVEVVVAPAFVHLEKVAGILKPEFKVAAQTVSHKGPGAFTGEISVQMLVDLGVEWVILGHSERRTGYAESDEIVSEKVKHAMAGGLKVILCVGETRAERDLGLTLEVLYRQLSAVKSAVDDWKKVVIAYEPIWAIGTGKSALPYQAEDVHKALRTWLRLEVSEEASQVVRIIYGGSVTPATCKVLILQPNIDGFLIGGAALKPGFKTIVETVNELFLEKSVGQHSPHAHL